MLSNVQIRNFKSIKELDIPCRRVNVFIGKPNVGKSNILEALSLFCAGYMVEGFFKPFVRMNQVQELFYRKSIKNPIYIDTDIGSLNLAFFAMDTYFMIIDPKKRMARENLSITYSNLHETQNFFEQKYGNEEIAPFELKPLFLTFGNNPTNNDLGFQRDTMYYSPIKKYSFTEFSNKATSLYYPYSLIPPDGKNIVTILLEDRELLIFFAEIFKDEYNLDLVVKSPENILEVHIKEGYITNSLPINLIADTLQRLIFYIAAIRSNHNSILLFEEPETHSYPQYVNMLAERIAKSDDNQFFITTHSPYLLNTLLEECPKDEIAIFITKYEDHQTSVVQLSDENISEIIDYGIDLFYNYQKFIE